MNFKKKTQNCKGYFGYLVQKLADTHELVPSCNNDESMYLIPKGTIDQLTYQSKPVDSYRFSTHWNWYANVNKCPDPNYVQCWNVDLPRPKQRAAEGKPSKPVLGICVARFGEDHLYHTVYGEVFNYRKRMWWFRTAE